MGSNKVASGGDEEFMEDLITLAPPIAALSEDSDCEIVSVSENKSRPAITKRPHSEKSKQIELESSYGKGQFSLPVQFFDIPRNIALLSKCRALKVNTVDCGKFPWYYRKICGVRKPRPKTKQIYSLQNLLEDMRFKQKLKQQKLEMCAIEKKEKSNEVVGKLNLAPSKLPDVDFKKNKGLVGLKIERKLVGLVFDEKRKNKHIETPTTPKITAESEESKAKITNIIYKSQASRELAKTSESGLEKVDKIVIRRDTSLKCSLKLNPLLSPSVQQKLLEITAKSLQSSMSPIDTVNSSPSNIQSNKTLVGQKVTHVFEKSIKVTKDKSNSGKKPLKTSKKKFAKKNKLPSLKSVKKNNVDVFKIVKSKDEICEKPDQKLIQTNKIIIEKTTTHTNKISDDTISGKISAATRMPKAPDVHPIPSSAPASLKNAQVIETINETSKQEDPNSEITPNKLTESELVKIKNEPEIKQELKDEALATDNASIEDSMILVTQPEQEMSSPSSKSLLTSFINSSVHTAPNEDVNELVIGQPIPVQEISNQNVVHSQCNQYNQPGLLATPNSVQNSQPPNLAASQPQPNVTNNQDTNQNIVTKPKFGDLKIQTVTQINNSVITPTFPALIEVVQDIAVLSDIQNNETKLNHPNHQPSQPIQALDTTNPVPTSRKINKTKEKKIVRVRNACMLPNRSRHVTPGPYTVPPPNQYRYQPIRNSEPLWQQNQHLANRMPTLMQQLNQHPRPMSQFAWESPPFNQDFYYRNHNANLCGDTYYPNWARHPPPPRPPPPPPPQYFPERRSRYVPPQERIKNNPSNNCSSKSVGGISKNELAGKATCSTGSPPNTLSTPGPQSMQGNNINRSPSLPSHSLPSVTSLPASPLLVPQSVQDAHIVDVLYPNTTFSRNYGTPRVIYSEGSSRSNVETHTNKQNVGRCILKINPTEMTVTPTKLSNDNEKEITKALDMPIIDSDRSDLLLPNDAANNVLSSQQQVKSQTPEKTYPASTSKPASNLTQIKKLPKKRVYIPDNETNNPPFNGTATSITERSVPAVLERNVKKGYSPPILPIPTIQKSLEILALKKRPPTQMGQSTTKARKISIDEYIKRQDSSKSIDLTDERQDDKKASTAVKEQSNNRRVVNNRGVDLQDLGYDSDHTSK